MLIFRQKSFQFCIPPLENSTTRITILCIHQNWKNFLSANLHNFQMQGLFSYKKVCTNPVGRKAFLFFSFLLRAKKKSDFFILEKPFFMQANPVFIMQTLCVCAGSKQILFFYN
jgi:hypothetical protein